MGGNVFEIWTIREICERLITRTLTADIVRDQIYIRNASAAPWNKNRYISDIGEVNQLWSLYHCISLCDDPAIEMLLTSPDLNDRNMAEWVLNVVKAKSENSNSN